MSAMTNGTNRQPGALMTIGEASRRSGFTIKALRFYERRGIVTPSTRRPNGYRVYSETNLGRLSFIRDAKALGLTLAAIDEILKGSNGDRRRRLLKLLDQRFDEATERIAALTRLRGELERRRLAVVRRRRPDREAAYCTCLRKTDPSK